MRKLTPEERAAKKAQAHVHTADCEHAVEAVTVAESPAEEAPAEDKPKRGRKKAEEVSEEAPAEESEEA